MTRHQPSRLQAESERAQEEARRRSHFLNALSHDLRTPLNGLLLQTHLAEMSLEAGDPQALKANLAEIRNSARAAAAVLDSLLEYARMDRADQQNQLNTIQIDHLLMHVVGQFRATAEQKGLSIQAHCREDLAVSTDGTKLQKILSILLSNAVKFTSAGGIRVEAESNGTDLEVHVIDSGVGIAAEHQQRLFEEFYQVHNHERDRRKGFGLGLAIARRLARQLGGDILLESTLGQGSRFTLVLPDACQIPSTGVVPSLAIA
jgi:signal transduction histidine kinase